MVVFVPDSFQVPQHCDLANEMQITGHRHCVGERVIGLPEPHVQIADRQHTSGEANCPVGVGTDHVTCDVLNHRVCLSAGLRMV